MRLAKNKKNEHTLEHLILVVQSGNGERWFECKAKDQPPWMEC